MILTNLLVWLVTFVCILFHIRPSRLQVISIILCTQVFVLSFPSCKRKLNGKHYKIHPTSGVKSIIIIYRINRIIQLSIYFIMDAMFRCVPKFCYKLRIDLYSFNIISSIDLVHYYQNPNRILRYKWTKTFIQLFRPFSVIIKKPN